MNRTRRVEFLVGGVMAVFVALSWNAETRASNVNQPKEVSPSDVVVTAAVEQSPVAETLVSDRCIRYRHHPTLRRICCKGGSMEVTLAVPDCCRCCTVAVPICVPCCCTDAPKICEGRGLFGRCNVTYEWCCGYKVTVAFDRCGNVIVHTFGRI